MTRQFEELLDECIEDIMSRRATVESCLARHSEYASQLEQPLRLAARLASIADLKPSRAAKTAGLRRLEAELAAFSGGPGQQTNPESSQAPSGSCPDRSVRLNGALEKGDKTQWTVQKRPIQISAQTAVSGNLKAGARVSVVGVLLGNGILEASVIDVWNGF